MPISKVCSLIIWIPQIIIIFLLLYPLVYRILYHLLFLLLYLVRFLFTVGVLVVFYVQAFIQLTQDTRFKHIPPSAPHRSRGRMTETMPLRCTICNSLEAKYCFSCHSATYCNSECQRTDWPVHRTVCKSFANLPKQPSPSHKLGILLPNDSNDPQLTWINCEQIEDEGGDEGGTYELPKLQEFLGEKHWPETLLITRNKVRGVSLDHTVVVSCRDAFLVDGISTGNKCVNRLTKGKKGMDWRGPVVVLGQPGTALYPLLYQDVTARDFRVAVDFLGGYNGYERWR
jgi:hypothetical protein